MTAAIAQVVHTGALVCEIDPDAVKILVPADHVLVRIDPDPVVEGVLRPWQISSPIQTGEVVEIGPGIHDVAKGDRVLIEAASAHEGKPPVLCARTKRLMAVIPCRWPDPAQTEDEAYAHREARLQALRAVLKRVYGKKKRWPFRAREEEWILMRDMEMLKRRRKGRCRSRLFSIVLDPARGQGVVAVIES